MATKIIANSTKVVDITAKKGDNFLVELEVKNENNNLVTFTRDAYTHENFASLTSLEKRVSLASEDLMLFVVTTDDGNPVLAACSSDLDLAMPYVDLDPTGHLLDNGNPQSGFYINPTNQREFDKKYDEYHVYKILAIADILSRASVRNTEEEKSNYNLDNLIFTEDKIHSRNKDENGYSRILESPFHRDWLYNIFTNVDVIKNSAVEDVLRNKSDLNLWNNNFEDNRYIFWGQVQGNNPFTINFTHDKFNLPKGTYKYTLKSFSNFTSLNKSGDFITVDGFQKIILEPAEEVDIKFRDVTTWIEGKLKIVE